MRIFQVGGSVRDEVMGFEASDVDFVVVGATSEDMVQQGFTQVGADFPVFIHPETGDEYALARTERKTSAGYHGFDVAFDPSVTLEDDLRRRDLTINAMAKDPDTGDIIDPFNGRADIQAGVLRHVSQAFAEDPVRVLRTARFAARFDFTVAPETVDLMKRLVTSGELDHLTAERVWQEVFRAVTESKHPQRFFEVLDQCGALQRIWPMLNDTSVWFLLLNIRRMAQDTVWHNANEGAKFGLLGIALKDEVLVQQWMASMKAPKFFVEAAVISVAAFRMLLGERRTGVWNADKVHELYAMTQGLKHDEVFEAVWGALALTNEFRIDQLKRGLDLVVDIVGSVRSIGFADLTPEQQSSLKGPDIGKAIVELRKNYIAKQLQA